MRKLFIPAVVVAAAMFAWAPIGIARVEYESTMLLVQKIFYFHFATWMAVTASVTVCGIASAIYLFGGTAAADHYAVASAELTTIFCLFGMFSGSLWGRKAWGVWWQWDARLTSSLLLFLMMVGYLIARRYGGPAGRKLSAALALFAAINVPLVYKSVDIWRTVHPQTTVVPKLDPRMRPAFWSAFVLITLVWTLLLTIRIRLERARAELETLRLDAEDLAEENR